MCGLNDRLLDSSTLECHPIPDDVERSLSLSLAALPG